MGHETTIAIETGKVTTSVKGYGEGCASADPVISAHPAVEEYHRALDEAMTISAYRNRPIKPIWKESQVKAMRAKKTGNG